MFAFIQDTLELNKLSKVMMLMYSSIEELKSWIDDKGVEYTELEKMVNLLDLAYIAKKGIFNRMYRQGWPISHRLNVPNIQQIWSITISNAFSLTIDPLYDLAAEAGILNIVDDIIKKDIIPDELEDRIYTKYPSSITKLLIR